MAVAVREMQREEYPLLEEFLYEAVFRRPGERVAREVAHRPELVAYIADFGARPGDLCLCAEADGRLAGAIWARRRRGHGYLDGGTPGGAARPRMPERLTPPPCAKAAAAAMPATIASAEEPMPRACGMRL